MHSLIMFIFFLSEYPLQAIYILITDSPFLFDVLNTFINPPALILVLRR